MLHLQEYQWGYSSNHSRAGRNNLIGNPYPSAIDGAAFIRDNSTVIEGTIYFWMHAIKIQLASGIKDGTAAGSGAYAYTSNDYSPSI
jgi:hypothetical protein